MNPFSKDFFINNRLRLREEFGGEAPIVISGNSFLQKSLDATYPFVQDSNFWYLTGVSGPGLVLVMDKAGDYLILPKQSYYMKTFGGVIDTTELREQSGIGNIYEYEKGWARLSKRLRSSKYVAGLEAPEQFVEELDMYTNPARARLVEMIFNQNPDLHFIDLRDALARLRIIKADQEIKAIREATAVTMESFKRLSDNLDKYTYEYEIAAQVTRDFISHNMDHAYEPIIASGENATVLHYVANNKKYRMGDLILIDVGASFLGYASDISRTIGVKPTKRQLDIHSAVESANRYALELLKPGVHMSDIEKKVREFVGKMLVELGLSKTVSKHSIRRYYPHATSHTVGLDVHDPMPKDGVLRPGMVLTIEPGLYIKEESIGVRIEDIVLITETGTEVLSGDLSRGAHSLRINQG